MHAYPAMYKCKQFFQGESMASLPTEIKQAVADCLRDAHLPDQARIAVTVGSRGIQNVAAIYRGIVAELKAKGYAPFLVAAMGSHGRGTAKGQREVLTSLGLTEKTVGAPIFCSDRVIQIGTVDDLPVFVVEEACSADGILIVNRIKPHTSFHGDYESGLLKMMAVGLGGPKGADQVHSLGARHLAQMIPIIANVVLAQLPIIGGIAILENAFEQTAVMKGVPPEHFFEEEKQLLLQAKAMMPQLPVDNIDLCLVGEMGKNYSGTGMDTNIIGRLRIQGMPEPQSPSIQYVGVLGLSAESHGNANGIGLADFTTEAVVSQIDREATYLNSLTSGFVMRAAIPMTFPHDRALVDGALKALKLRDPKELRMVYIQNTLHLEEIWVSEAIHAELRQWKDIQCEGESMAFSFDMNGKLLLNP